MTDKESPEYLRNAVAGILPDWVSTAAMKRVDALVAAERRTTVERIRSRLDVLPTYDKRSVPGGLHVHRMAVRAILDEEAAR